MNFTKLPSSEAKSLSFLTFALIGFIFFNISDDFFTKIVDLIVTIISFSLATLQYMKKNIKLPLFPCKNRCNNTKELICQRDKGFIVGLIISILLIKFVPTTFIVEYKNLSLIIGLSLATTTIIHGTLRRYFGLFKNHNSITFLVGMITGTGVLFLAIYFIDS